MSLLRWVRSLFNKHERRVVHDPYLGDICNDPYGNWNGSKFFEPTNCRIDFTFRTGENPPKTEQVEFFHEVESRFPEIWHKLRQELFAAVPEFDYGHTKEQLFDSFKVNWIAFWDVTNPPFQWEISCTTPLDEHVFGIRMSDFENRGFQMDG